MDTREYYGGLYPNPLEEEKIDCSDDYEGYIADVMYEEKELEIC